MAIINVNDLVSELNSDKREYEKIFGKKLRTLESAKQHFVPFPVGKEGQAVLVRETLSNITQPGRRNSTNFTTAFATLKNRIAKPRPIKVDLKMTELELAALHANFIARKEDTDPRDIYGIANRSYLMGRVFSKIQDEITRAMWKGVYNASNGVQGGLNLFNGLEVLTIQGYLEEAEGGVGDIPIENKVLSPAASITKANVIAELLKLRQAIESNEYIEEYIDDPGVVYCDRKILVALGDALEEAESNRDMVVTKDKDTGVYSFNAYPNIIFKSPSWMRGTGNMFYTLEGNLFYLYEDQMEMDGPVINFERQARDLNIFIDGSASVDYADGRAIILYK